MQRRSRIALVVGGGIALLLLVFRHQVQELFVVATQSSTGKKTVSDRVRQFGTRVDRRLGPRFREIGVQYPPDHITLAGLKDEGVLEVWVSDARSRNRFLKSYPIRAKSGKLGPKLAEGDCQVPEGLYRIESLNPNSAYHLALRVSYPNAFDQAMGKRDGRANLGSDIMIHGKAASIGCLAMGDEAAEDLFVLAARSGIENIDVILSPVDFRVRELPANMPKVPEWTSGLYRKIREALGRLKGDAPR